MEQGEVFEIFHGLVMPAKEDYKDTIIPQTGREDTHNLLPRIQNSYLAKMLHVNSHMYSNPPIAVIT